MAHVPKLPWLRLFQRQRLREYVDIRAGERKLGEAVALAGADGEKALDLRTELQSARNRGAAYVVLGIREDIGPRANYGRGGAGGAFDAAMHHFLNYQSNRFFTGEECLVLGEVAIDDKEDEGDGSLEELREMVAVLDERVVAVTTEVMHAGMQPVVVGGGHNNCFGLLTSASKVHGGKISAVNLDPHSDFRPCEGRHSGNGFSYAAETGALGYYHVLGLHELKNSEATLQQLDDHGAEYTTFQDIWVRQKCTLADALRRINDRLHAQHGNATYGSGSSSGSSSSCRTGPAPVGVELDLDAVRHMPASASTAVGVPLLDALRYVDSVARHNPTAYLHLAEGAPGTHVAGSEAGGRDVGQSVSELMYTYMQAAKSQGPSHVHHGTATHDPRTAQ